MNDIKMKNRICISIWRKGKVVGMVIAAIIILAVLFILFRPHKEETFGKKYENTEWLLASADNFVYKEKQENVEDKSTQLTYHMSGKETLWVFTVDDNTEIHIECDNQLKSGRAKLILVSESQQKIQNICEGTGQGKYTVWLYKGKNRLRFVGDEAIGTIKIKIDCKDSVNIETVDNQIHFNW